MLCIFRDTLSLPVFARKYICVFLLHGKVPQTTDDTRVPRNLMYNLKQYHESSIPAWPRYLLQGRLLPGSLELELLHGELEEQREDGQRQAGEKAGGGGRRKLELPGTFSHYIYISSTLISQVWHCKLWVNTDVDVFNFSFTMKLLVICLLYSIEY